MGTTASGCEQRFKVPSPDFTVVLFHCLMEQKHTDLEKFTQTADFLLLQFAWAEKMGF